MNSSSIDLLIDQHFSIDALSGAPAPVLKALALMRDWLSPDRPHSYPRAAFADLATQLSVERMPAKGISVDAFLDQMRDVVMANTAQLNHPMFIGHMTQSLPWITVLAEAFTAALNQNQVKIETAFVSTLIEKQILGWLHRRVYRAEDAFYAEAMMAKHYAIGNIVNGGTMGNLTALAVALEQQLPGTRKAGLAATLAASGYRGLAVLGSARMHYSMKKAVATLGLGEDALQLIPVDRDNRVNMALLRDRLDELRAGGIKVIALVGIAGTTETGAIDPLAELAELAEAEALWFHVDAAWGGALLLADRYMPLYQGIERADSVVVDGHKAMWVPMAQGMVLFKDKDSLNCLKHNANYIIRSDSGDLGQTSLEGSRRFDALKLWTSIKVLGLDGYAALLAQAAALTSQMIELIRQRADFELITESKTFILTYRFVPPDARRQLETHMAAGEHDLGLALNARLNRLNAELQETQKLQGEGFVSRTVLESTAYPGNITVLRVVLSNVTTTAVHLRRVLDEQSRIGTALLRAYPMDSATTHGNAGIEVDK